MLRIGNFPLSALAMSVGLNATLTSYNDRMNFGFVGNGATMHDLQELARHVQQAYEELRKATSPRQATRRRTVRKKAARSRS